MWSVWLVFCDCGFHSVCPLMNEYKRLVQASWWEGLCGENSLILVGKAMLNKSLIQFSADGSLCFLPVVCLRPFYGRGNGDLLQKALGQHTALPSTVGDKCPWSSGRPLLTHASTRNSQILTGKSCSVSYGVTAPFSWFLICTSFCLCRLRVCFPVL